MCSHSYSASTAIPFCLLLLLLLLRAPLGANGLDVTINGRPHILSTSPELGPYPVTQLPRDPRQPRNIHLAFGRTERDLMVTWSTLADVSPSLVQFRRLGGGGGGGSDWQLAKGWSTKFVDGGALRAVQFVHRAALAGLAPGARYQYCVVAPGTGSNCSGSAAVLLEFRVPGGAAGRSFAIFGDFGLANAQSLPRLLNDVTVRRLYDAVIHVGDFAYDMPDENGTVGDRFMQMLQPIAGRVQYMTCVGNHEQQYNFSHYKARFSMPGSSRAENSMFYSVNIGPVHLVSISNEFYFFTNYGSEQIARQHRWLEADLLRANRNRTAAPWIVLIGHRPMYCSNNSTSDCDWGARTLREGFNGRWALEPLLMKHGVDLAFWGHEHSYERTLPVNDSRVIVAKGGDPYVNPRAPVHVITGSAGNKEKHAYFRQQQPAYSAFRSTDYGYTRVRFQNDSHVYLEQVSDDRAGQVIDKFTLVQTRHGSFLHDGKYD